MAESAGSIPGTSGALVDSAGAATPGADHAWVLQLIERDGEAILRLLWRILGSEQDVLDAYQDCFCKLAARSGKVDPRSAKAYAYRTATNIAIEMLRTRRRHMAHWPRVIRYYAAAQPESVDAAVGLAIRDAEPGPPAPDDRRRPSGPRDPREAGPGGEGEARLPTPSESQTVQRPEHLRDAIAQLPPHLYRVVVLRDLSRLSYNEVGKVLGIEPTTARVYRRHAVVRLAELLGHVDVL